MSPGHRSLEVGIHEHRELENFTLNPRRSENILIFSKSVPDPPALKP